MKSAFSLLLVFYFSVSYSQIDSLTYYSNKGEYKKALNYVEKFKLEKSNSNYIELITWKAELNYELGNLNEAERYYKTIENNLDSLNILYQNLKFYRHNIGVCYYDNGKINEARKNFNIHIKENIDKKERIINSIEQLAKINEGENDFKVSDSLYLKILNLREKEFGTQNKSYSKTLMLYAILKEKENNLVKADSLFNQAIAINSQIKNQDFNSNLFQAQLYINFRLYEKAETNLLTILKNYKDLKLSKDDVYWKVIIELISLYNSIGNISYAERIIETIDYKKINDINLKLEYLDVLAILYKKINNSEKLIEVVGISSNIRVDNFDEVDEEFAKGLNNLAMLNMDLGEYDKALKYLIHALNIHNNKYGLQNKIASAYIKNIGDVYSYLNNYINAEKYYKTALNITRDIYGINNEKFLSVVNSLSILYYTNNKPESALDLYKEYYTKTNLALFSKFDSNYFITLMNFGLFYYTNNEFIEASSKFEESLQLIKMQKLEVLNFMTYSEFEQFKVENNYIDLISTFLQLRPTKHSYLNISCFEYELLLKNLSLRNQQRIKNSIEKSTDAFLKDKYQQFVSNKRYLTKQEQLSLAERSTDYESLKTETENLEKDITRQSTTFAEAKKTLSIIWKQIQEKLQPNEVVLDLVSYNYYNKKWTDSIMYGAFVIKKDSKFPKYITLFEEKQLKQLLKKENNSIVKTRINQQYQSKAISDLFLKPLEQELNGCKTIYLSPSGLSHQINFKALPINENKTLGEQFSIKLLGSSASIVTYTSNAFQENKNLQFILYGGIDYAKNSTVTTTNESDKVAVRSNFEGGFGYLKGTLPEINDIADQVKANKYEAILKTERYATEESIKQLDGKTEPFVLHLATHGFFYENAKTEIKENNLISENQEKAFFYKASEDPMLRSGLAFAGANKTWGKIKEETSMDDGILTAKEISNLDLSNCQLVVLSACETGLGDINGSEGVFGLQRAFKMAGVKNIIMSLWKVPDAQTAELFTIFYAECFSGKTIHEAFQRAQAKMKVRYSPYYWAGFVLLE